MDIDDALCNQVIQAGYHNERGTFVSAPYSDAYGTNLRALKFSEPVQVSEVLRERNLDVHIFFSTRQLREARINQQ